MEAKRTEDELVCYETMPIWNRETLPVGLRERHHTQAGTWTKLDVRAGRLRFEILDEKNRVVHSCVLDQSSDAPLVAPQAWHKVQPVSDDLELQLSLYCRSQSLYQKKYRLSPPDEAVVEVLKYIKTGLALDIGCGFGRNALSLLHSGLSVHAFDTQLMPIRTLHSIIDSENLRQIQAFVGDARAIDLTQSYNVVVNTQMLMLLPAQDVSLVLEKMRAITRPRGYNVVVCPMSNMPDGGTAQAFGFEFAFGEQELARVYDGWRILRYDERLNQLSALDVGGEPLGLKVATLVAQRV